MHAQIRWTFSRLRQADFRSPNHALVTNDDAQPAGFPCNTARMCVLQHAQSLSQVINHRQAQRFKVTAFATLGCCCFPHKETHWTGAICHKLYINVITTHDPYANQLLWFQRTSCYLLRLLSFTADSFFELSQTKSQYTDCIPLHVTSKTSFDCVNNFRQPRVKQMKFVTIILANSRLIFMFWSRQA